MRVKCKAYQNLCFISGVTGTTYLFILRQIDKQRSKNIKIEIKVFQKSLMHKKPKLEIFPAYNIVFL